MSQTRNDGWEVRPEMDISFWHCGRPAYWDGDLDDSDVICSKCQEIMPPLTPSTEVIRHWCAWGVDDEFSQERAEQFDRWLADQLAAERDRMITVIKDAFGEDYYDTGVSGLVVSLIKGESK